MSAHLLRSRKFAPLFWCQFFAAFNDTYLKSALTFIVIAKLAPATANTLTLVGSILLTAPPFLLAALGGEWADRYDKARVAQWLKLVEFGAVAIAAAGFVFESVPLLFTALAMFGVLSALFGPVKYGILPDHLTKEQLPGGNALVEGATFIAAILGPTVAAIATRSTDRYALGSRLVHPLRGDRLRLGASHPADRPGRAQPEGRSQPAALDLASRRNAACRQEALAGRHHYQPVLVDGRRRLQRC